jgi:hypothetical protein
VNNEFPGAICYTNDGGNSCVAVSFPVSALSFWAIGALLGGIFGRARISQTESAG